MGLKIGYTNSIIHPKIQTTIENSRKQVPFLDVEIIMKHGSIPTDIFTKRTDKHLYVDKMSEHSNTTKNTIPYGQAIRAHRKVPKEEKPDH